MELLIALVVIVVIAWFWRVRQADKQTMQDFDAWLHQYHTATSASKRSRMAVAFLNQSIHYAWSTGAINSKQREVVTRVLKQMKATTTLVSWFGSALPAVERATSVQELSNTPARAVGMLLLIAWMAQDGDGESAVRQYLLSLIHI